MSSTQRQKPSPTGNNAEWDEEPWRHPPVAPKDAGVGDSLGKAVSDVVTGPLEGTPAEAKKPGPARKP